MTDIEKKQDDVTTKPPLTLDEARALTAKIRGRAEELWYMLLEAYERKAHIALGYSSWGEYFEGEFGASQSRGYQLIDSGRVLRAIEAIEGRSTMVERPNERQARELAPLVREDPQEAATVWPEVVQSRGPNVTASDVRQAVSGRRKPRVRDVLTEEDMAAVGSGEFDRFENMASRTTNLIGSIKHMSPEEVANTCFRLYGDKLETHVAWAREIAAWYSQYADLLEEQERNPTRRVK